MSDLAGNSPDASRFRIRKLTAPPPELMDVFSSLTRTEDFQEMESIKG